jgi:hypothetical protein
LNPTQGLAGDITAFLKCQREQGFYSAAAVDSKGAILRKFPDWSGMSNTPAVTPAMIASFYENLRGGFGGSLQPACIFCLRALLGWCVDQHIIRENPVIGVKPGRVTPTFRIYFCTREERDRFIGQAPREDRQLVASCGFQAGLRKNEIIQPRAAPHLCQPAGQCRAEH